MRDTDEYTTTVRYRRRRRANTPDGLVYCGHCDRDKSPSKFSVVTSNPTGYSYRCDECRKVKTVAERGKRLLADRKKNYGISEDEYRAMYDLQGGLCAICGQTGKRIHKGAEIGLCVDHDHETGQVRGLLCMLCNQGLGNFRDSPENLSNAIDYLMRLNR